MIFDDIFYPGNPQRRADVTNLRADIRSGLNSFKTGWNDLVTVLNPILAPKNIVLSFITCDIDTSCLQNCVSHFNQVLNDSKPKIDKLVSDIGLSNGIPDLPSGNVNLDPDAMHKISQWLSLSLDTAVSGFASWYVYRAIQFFIVVINYGGVATTALGEFLAGALGGIIVGAVAFVITDMIISAITGAVERRELNEAIDALTKIRDTVSDPLAKAAVRLAGIAQNVKDGTYQVSETIIIVGGRAMTIDREGMRLHNNFALYLVLDGKVRHIPNPATYDQLFADWNGYKEAQNIQPAGDALTDGAYLARDASNGKVYLVNDGVRRWITSPAVFDKYYFGAGKVRDTVPDFDKIAVGANIS
jgi:hypothetical protein